MRQDITQTVQDAVEFCQQQIMSLAASPVKRNVLLIVVTAILSAGSDDSLPGLLLEPTKDKPTWPTPPTIEQ